MKRVLILLAVVMLCGLSYAQEKIQPAQAPVVKELRDSVQAPAQKPTASYHKAVPAQAPAQKHVADYSDKVALGCGRVGRGRLWGGARSRRAARVDARVSARA